MRVIRLVVFLLVAAASWPLFSFPGSAQTQRIAAVVNTEVISVLDVNERYKLILFTSSLTDTTEQRQQLRPRVVRQLIDEALQRQEAKRLNITLRESDVTDAFRQIEQRNRIEAGGFDAFLARNGLNRSTLEAQVRAQLIWQQVVARRVSPNVEIGEEEIDQVLERIAAAKGQIENRVAEIVLAIDNPREEADTLALAERLVAQLRGGANFASVASQFSQSASAAVGGDLGWIQSGQLDPVLDKAISTMSQGQLSPPLRIDNTIHIVLLIGRRQIAAGTAQSSEYSLRQVLLPMAPDAPKAEAQVIAERLLAATRDIASCADFAAKAKELGTPQTPDPVKLNAADIAPDLRRLLDGLPVNKATIPFNAGAGMQVIFICGREVQTASGQPDRREIGDQIGRERLDMYSRRYLRDLQRAALIEVRE